MYLLELKNIFLIQEPLSLPLKNISSESSFTFWGICQAQNLKNMVRLLHFEI